MFWCFVWFVNKGWIRFVVHDWPHMVIRHLVVDPAWAPFSRPTVPYFPGGIYTPNLPGFEAYDRIHIHIQWGYKISIWEHYTSAYQETSKRMCLNVLAEPLKWFGGGIIGYGGLSSTLPQGQIYKHPWDTISLEHNILLLSALNGTIETAVYIKSLIAIYNQAI